MKSKVIKIILVLIVMITIFMFSNQTSDQSQELSNNIAYKTKEIITNKNCNGNKCIATNYNKIIRKIAHFTLYFILGITVYLLLKEYTNKRLILYTIIFCLLYAISDEIHQIFVPGRSFQVFDIFIDTIGSIASIALMKLIKK